MGKHDKPVDGMWYRIFRPYNWMVMKQNNFCETNVAKHVYKPMGFYNFVLDKIG